MDSLFPFAYSFVEACPLGSILTVLNGFPLGHDAYPINIAQTTLFKNGDSRRALHRLFVLIVYILQVALRACIVDSGLKRRTGI